MYSRRLRQSHCLLLSVCATIVVAGCGKSSKIPRVVVSGSVTLNGAPVEDGQIRYVPIEGTVGPVTMARIVGGEYVCDDKGGVPVGKHRVEISAWDPKLPPGGRGEPTRPNLVPAKFNDSSELVEMIADESGRVEKNFTL
jgi:hypothetical protein